jgi:adenylate cyclase class 2
MREIEIKARASNHQQIIDAIVERGGVVSEPVTQHDRVYGVPGVPGASENNEPWLRIRTETKGDSVKHFFTLKKSITNQLDSMEYETEISNDKELEKIIENINFAPYSDLTKTRRKAKIADIEVCIDSVEGLGDFVEAEKMMPDDADYMLVIDELWLLLESLGVSKADEVTDGYDVLMNKHLGRE